MVKKLENVFEELARPEMSSITGNISFLFSPKLLLYKFN